MTAPMKLTEETSTRIVLETDPSSRKWGEYLRMLVVPPLLLAGALIFLNFPTWVNWVITILAVLIEILMIVVVSSELTNVTVTIDKNYQRATRTEKLFFKRTRKHEF